jgi:CSLREA domain-containing protein
MLRAACVFTVLVLIAALGPEPTRAAIFVVTTSADAEDFSPGDGSCDANQSPAVSCTLRAAVQEANALAGDDSISLPAGTYALTLAGIEDLAASGDLDVDSAIVIEGAGAELSIIEQTTEDRVFEVWFSPASLTLVGVTLRGGDAGTEISSLGGGIRNLGQLSLDGVHVTGNTARLGAGVYNYGALQIVDSVIDDNLASERIAGIASASTSASGNESTTLEMYASTVGPNITSGNPTEIELGNGASAAIYDSTITPANLEFVTVDIANENVLFNHVTLRGALRAFSYDGSHGLTISNSVVEWCNYGGSLPDILLVGVNASRDDTCGFAASSGIEAPLLLGALADNGGPTPTHLPQAGSPLIGTASNAACRATDQRGVARPQGAVCDVGAVEVVPEPGAIGAALVAIAALVRLRRHRHA